MQCKSYCVIFWALTFISSTSWTNTHRHTHALTVKFYHPFFSPWLFLSLPFSVWLPLCWLSESVSCMTLPCCLFTMVLSLELYISTAFMPLQPYFEVCLHLPRGTIAGAVIHHLKLVHNYSLIQLGMCFRVFFTANSKSTIIFYATLAVDNLK